MDRRWYDSRPGAEPPYGVLVCVTSHLTIRWKPSSFSGLPPIKVTAARVSPLPLLLSPSVPPLTRTAHLCSKLGEKVGRRSDRQRLTALGGQARPGQRSLSFSEVPSRGLCFGLRHDRDRDDRAHHKNMVGFSRAQIIGAGGRWRRLTYYRHETLIWPISAALARTAGEGDG